MRQLAKFLLRLLTKWAIKKHKMEIILVLGERHSRLSSYLIWEVLREDYFTRCQWDKSFWDLSIPLTVLGYDAAPHGHSSWVSIIIQSFFVLLFGKSQPQKIILPVPYSLPEILKYWLSVVKPNVVVYFNEDENLERFKYIRDLIEKNRETKLVEIGEEVISGKGFSQVYDQLKGFFWKKPISAAYSVGKIFNVRSEDIVERLQKVEPTVFLKVREKLSSSSDGK